MASATAATLPRPLKWIAGLFLVLGVLIVLFVAFFDWNWLREPVARRVASSTGRTFAINGDLEVHLALRPRIVANDLVLGNAQWSREPTMATIKRLDFRLDLIKWLFGSLDFPDMALSEPHLVLEVSPDGTPNWVFHEEDKDKPVNFPAIGALTIDRGSAIYRDPRIKTDLALDVKTVEGSKDNPELNLEVTGKGRFKGMPSTLHARGGALLSLRDAEHPYPIKANATLGTTKASIDGMLVDPLHLKGEQLNFRLEGSDLALLFPIIGVPIPPTPPTSSRGSSIIPATSGLSGASTARSGKAISPEISRSIAASNPR